MKPVEPLSTLELFPALSAELLALLRNLSFGDWARPTACPDWSVKDIVAHLLDGNIRRLSFRRDGLPRLSPDFAIATNADLIKFLNQLNAEWVRAAKRISPALLIEFLELTDRQLYDFFKTLPLDQPAAIGVGWAGEKISLNWFDIGREFTEKWLHQQQIREAVGQKGLIERRWLHPVLAICLRALPYTYRDVEAEAGTTINLWITGEASGQWSLVRHENDWRLYVGVSSTPAVSIHLSDDTAWRLLSKGLKPEEMPSKIQLEGDPELGSKIFEVVAIMA